MTSLLLTLNPYDTTENIFRPGQMLRGIVTLSLTNPKKFRGLALRVFGQSRTEFLTQGTKKPIQQEGVEVYLNKNIYLFGRQDGPAFELRAGTHKYKFSCQLPERLPNSTKLKYGNIEYFVEAVLEVPYLIDKEVRVPFFVDCDDLNYCESLKEPVKRVALFESLCTTIMLPCSGFVPDQIIPITIFYENNSDNNILRTKIALVQSIEYKNKEGSHTKYEKYVVVENYADGVNARNQKSVTTDFRIPDVVISNTKYCGIISVRYMLDVEPELCGINGDIKLEIPIIIGKIPMRVIPQIPMPTYASAPPAEQFDNELPPSYEELMRLNPH
ncbi:arrestin domain-containing protein 4-like [Chironomus tepperi]|uniref:arrestin domain-containing protein 4-like n=1 Tax=Chironomus tepperi TaxID=113505 RepID=UPI00391EEB0D